MACHLENRTTRRRKAFTLVELMVVIVVIALLVAILMPALNLAYKTALKSADSALLSQISMGCEAYNQVFHEYPPSTWDPVNNPAASLWPPPPIPQSANYTSTVQLAGAGKVFAALSGFKTTALPGSTGINTFGCNNANPLMWRYPCGELTSRGIIVDTNPTDASGNLDYTSEDKVYGPYYNPDEKGQTMTTCTWNSRTAQQRVFASRFQQQNPPTPPTGGTPETGAPILYYRANPAPADYDQTGWQGYGTVDSWDIYSYLDNFIITDPGQTAYLNAKDRWMHGLFAPSDGKDGKGGPYNPAGVTSRTAFYGISKPYPKSASGSQYPSPAIPYNANTFILISPGPDGIYFTDDDITNFK